MTQTQQDENTASPINVHVGQEESVSQNQDDLILKVQDNISDSCNTECVKLQQDLHQVTFKYHKEKLQHEKDKKNGKSSERTEYHSKNLATCFWKNIKDGT